MLTYIVMTTAVKLLRISSRLFVSSLLVLPFVGVISFISPSTAHANPAVVINELMYNPASDNQDEEYLELYNTSGAPIDVSDWCFTAGISGCFTSGTTIAANGYLVVSPSSSQTQTTYSLTPDLVYSGNLSNGGETITLTDNNAVQVDTLTYDDASPWPTTPDGNGPSLELKNPDADNSQAAAWAASLSSGGTPNTQNSVYGIELPEITDVSRHTFVASSTAVTVTAEIEDSTDVDLVYKIMFDAEVTIPMHDDGSHNDGASGDGVYGAQIPGQDAGTLVRYKIQATNPDGTASSPGNDDSVNYYPYIVEDGQESDIPIVRWYMDPNDYTDMTTNHLTDDEQFPAVVAVGEQIFDGAYINVKGQSTVNFAKKKYKFHLAQGDTLGQPYFSRGVDEFVLNHSMPNFMSLGEMLGWRTASLAQLPSLEGKLVGAYRNTADEIQQDQGVYLLLETYDGAWREHYGYDEGAFYKNADNKKTRLDEGTEDIDSFQDALNSLTGISLRNYIINNIDVPNAINYDAVQSVTRNVDWSFYGNVIHYRDTDNTQRWSVLLDDLDGAYSLPYIVNQDAPPWDFAPPASVGGVQRLIQDAMYQFPEFQELYKRRVSQLFTQLYGANKQVDSWVEEAFGTYSDTIDRDLNIWRSARVDLVSGLPGMNVDPGVASILGLSNPATAEQVLQAINATDVLGIYKYDQSRFSDDTQAIRVAEGLPFAQPEKPKVIINEIHYNPAGGNNYEYLELYNPNDYAVDISNWSFTSGINLTLPGGSVLPAKGYAVLVKNDTDFRNHYSANAYVLAEYSGDLSNEGETITLSRSDGSVASTVSYGVNGAWPESANGDGYSLQLVRLTADETLSACWAPSSGIGGTPGTINNPDQAWLSDHGAGCKDRSSYSADGTSGSLADTGSNVTLVMVIAGGLIVVSLYPNHELAIKDKAR